MNAVKKYAILAAVGVGLLVGGYATGRYAAPDKVVVTKEVQVVHEVQVVKTEDTEAVINALKSVVQNTQKNVHQVRTTVKAKDGTVTTTVTTDDKSKTDTQTKTEGQTKTSTKTAEATHVVDTQTQIVTKVVERNRPDWKLSVMPGIEVGEALGRTPTYSLLPGDQGVLKYVVVGVALERRLVGPLLGGVWANTHGAAGLMLSLEF
jgi:hypothetical protein